MSLNETEWEWLCFHHSSGFGVNAALCVRYSNAPQRSSVGHAHDKGFSRLTGQSSATSVHDGP